MIIDPKGAKSESFDKSHLSESFDVPAGCITSRERDPLNRLGHVIVWSLGRYTALRTFKLSWEPPNQNRRVLLYFTVNTAQLTSTNKYENFTIVSPSRTEGHTLTQE